MRFINIRWSRNQIISYQNLEKLIEMLKVSHSQILGMSCMPTLIYYVRDGFVSYATFEKKFVMSSFWCLPYHDEIVYHREGNDCTRIMSIIRTQFEVRRTTSNILRRQPERMRSGVKIKRASKCKNEYRKVVVVHKGLFSKRKESAAFCHYLFHLYFEIDKWRRLYSDGWLWEMLNIAMVQVVLEEDFTG